MTFVPRTKDARVKLQRPTGPPAPGSRTLACGHTTTAPPLTTGARTLYTCPQGCGLQPTR
jgi:hypothetical protein